MTFEAFKNAFLENYEKFLAINRLKKEIEKTEERIDILNSAIMKTSGLKISYPLIVGNSFSRASIIEIGEFPPFGFTQNCICHFVYGDRFFFAKYIHEKYFKNISNQNKATAHKLPES